MSKTKKWPKISSEPQDYYGNGTVFVVNDKKILRFDPCDFELKRYDVPGDWFPNDGEIRNELVVATADTDWSKAIKKLERVVEHLRRRKRV